MSETVNPTTAVAEKPKEEKNQNRNRYIRILIVIGLIVLMPLVVYLIKQSEISKINQKHKTAMDNICHKADSLVAASNMENLQNVTRVFAWAVRSEILRNNMEQINTYMTELVRIKGFTDISLLGNDGIVKVSTNKKFEGIVYPGPVTKELAQITQVSSRTDEKGNVMSVCPVVGLDSRLGSLVINYSPPAPVFAKEEASQR